MSWILGGCLHVEGKEAVGWMAAWVAADLVGRSEVPQQVILSKLKLPLTLFLANEPRIAKENLIWPISSFSSPLRSEVLSRPYTGGIACMS